MRGLVREDIKNDYIDATKPRLTLSFKSVHKANKAKLKLIQFSSPFQKFAKNVLF